MNGHWLEIFHYRLLIAGLEVSTVLSMRIRTEQIGEEEDELQQIAKVGGEDIVSCVDQNSCNAGREKLSPYLDPIKRL